VKDGCGFGVNDACGIAVQDGCGLGVKQPCRLTWWRNGRRPVWPPAAPLLDECDTLVFA